MTLNENDIDSLIEYLQSTWKDLSESADPLAIIKESSLPFLNENMFHMFEKYFEKIFGKKELLKVVGLLMVEKLLFCDRLLFVTNA